jgi:hypothetical protein
MEVPEMRDSHRCPRLFENLPDHGTRVRPTASSAFAGPAGVPSTTAEGTPRATEHLRDTMLAAAGDALAIRWPVGAIADLLLTLGRPMTARVRLHSRRVGRTRAGERGV